MEKKLASQLVIVDSLSRAATLIEGLVIRPNAICHQDDISEKLGQLKEKIVTVNTNLNYLHQCHTSYNDWMDNEKELWEKLKTLEERLDHLENNLPRECLQQIAASLRKISPSVDPSRYNGGHATLNGSISTASLLAETEPKTVVKKTIDYPQIKHLTQHELDGVPSYIRNRLPLDVIKTFVDSFNAVLKKKYTLLKLPRNKVPKTEIPLYTAWKAQDNKETKGHAYITGTDLNTHGPSKLSKRDFHILQILRHCKRLKESKVNKECHYILLN